jgi:hypothetical protein
MRKASNAYFRPSSWLVIVVATGRSLWLSARIFVRTLGNKQGCHGRKVAPFPANTTSTPEDNRSSHSYVPRLAAIYSTSFLSQYMRFGVATTARLLIGYSTILGRIRYSFGLPHPELQPRGPPYHLPDYIESHFSLRQSEPAT